MKRLLFWIRVIRDPVWGCKSFCGTCKYYAICRSEKA